MIDGLAGVEKEVRLSPVQKILLTTDGSITRVFEALTGEKVSVDTKEQRIIPADKKIAKALKIDQGDEVNFRVVNLKNSKGILVRATSYAPLKRIDEGFREKITKADVPIGKIMSELKIEARREITGCSVIRADERLAGLFKVSENSPLLKRNYNIIHKNEVLLNITEIFSCGI
ncbi:MAG: chorismate pyruvate-lyase family protein [Candidatus Hydrothermarchaeaceae archaeon]